MPEGKVRDAVKEAHQKNAPLPTTAPTEHWSQCEKMPYGFISKDFVHDSVAALKVNLTSVRGGVTIKGNVREDKTGPHIYDETRLWFTLPKGRSFYAELRTGETIKTHFENGLKEIFGQKINFYSTLSFTRQLKNLKFKLGLKHNTDNSQSDVRLKIGDREKDESFFSAHSHFYSGNWTYGYLASVNLYPVFLTKNQIMLGRKFGDKDSAFLRISNQNFRKHNPHSIHELFDLFTLNYIRQHDQKTKFGFETQLETRRHHLLKWAAFVLQQEVKDDVFLKFRVAGNTSRLEINGQVTLPITKKEESNFTLGFHGVNLHKPDREIKWGTEFQVNI